MAAGSRTGIAADQSPQREQRFASGGRRVTVEVAFLPVLFDQIGAAESEARR